jgi:predicted transcriptional regulator
MNARTLIIDALIERVASLAGSGARGGRQFPAGDLRPGTLAYRTTPEERAAILRGLAEANRGEFVSDEEMAVSFKRHGL